MGERPSGSAQPRLAHLAWVFAHRLRSKGCALLFGAFDVKFSYTKPRTARLQRASFSALSYCLNDEYSTFRAPRWERAAFAAHLRIGAGLKVARAEAARSHFAVDDRVCSCFVQIMAQLGWHSRGYLPHFDVGGLVQHVVIHTQAALPIEFLAWLETASAQTRRRQVDLALDGSQRGAVFSDGFCAAAAEDQLLHFQGTRYDLLGWCIMPNHIHVILCVYTGATLGQIIRSWKVLSTSAINRHYRTKRSDLRVRLF